MNETVVVNKHLEDYDVDITRPSVWSNPYSHNPKSAAKFIVNNRREAIKKFEEYLLNSPELLKRLPELQGKRLGCVCKPNKACHGDILVKHINATKNSLL